MPTPADRTERFEQYVAQLAAAVQHRNRHEPVRAYLTGLYLPGERKSVEPLAARVDPRRVRARHQSLHHFVANAAWADADILGQRFDVPRGSKVDITLTNPQEMMFSVYRDLTRDLAIMGNFGWQNWKAFGNTSVSIHEATTIEATADLHFSNTYHWAIGAMYRVTPAWLLTARFAYDTSPVEEKDRTVTMPVDRQIRYAVGVQYDLSARSTLGVAYTLINGGDAPVNQAGGPLRGRWSATTTRTCTTPSAS